VCLKKNELELGEVGCLPERISGEILTGIPMGKVETYQSKNAVK
jgi:hypothetical protein